LSATRKNNVVIPAKAGIHFLSGSSGRNLIVKQPAVYILASGLRGTLYTGVTGSLRHRTWEHREGLVDGFTKKHSVKRLVWFQIFDDFPSAIARENS